jgi:hypothetical protein
LASEFMRLRAGDIRAGLIDSERDPQWMEKVPCSLAIASEVIHGFLQLGSILEGAIGLY